MSEVDRLLALAARTNDALRTAVIKNQTLQQQVERLRDHIKLLNSFRPDAELARLRGLLRDLLSCQEEQHGPEYIELVVTRVREALGE